MNKKTKLSLIPVTVAALLGGALLWGNTAGAKPIEGDGALGPIPTPAPPFADAQGKGHNVDADAWAVWATDAIQRLNAGKKNEDGLLVQTGQVDVELTDASAAQTGQGRVDFAEPFPEAIAEGGTVTVLAMPVRNLDQPDNAPVVIQPFGNSVSGFNFRALNKAMAGIDGQTVRITYVAYATAAPAEDAG